MASAPSQCVCEPSTGWGLRFSRFLTAAGPQDQSVAAMAVASALHFAGYEMARAGTLSLFTSRRTGFVSASAASFATAMVSPFSMLLLWGYTRVLDRKGPRTSLLISTLSYALLLAMGSFLLQNLMNHIDFELHRRACQSLLFFLYVAENAWVQLLYTQQWSFLNSIQAQANGGLWFGPIAGLGSVSTSLAGLWLASLVQRGVTLPTLLLIASGFLLAAAVSSDWAYAIAEKNGFAPRNQHHPVSADQRVDNAATPPQKKKNLWSRATTLFRRVPVLGALCAETVVCQCLSSLVSFLFIWSMKEVVKNDSDRAAYTGKTYVWINAVSAALQFGVLPIVMKRMQKQVQVFFWFVMPTMMLVAALWSVFLAESVVIGDSAGNDQNFFENDKSVLLAATVSFALMKTLEYSARSVATEMVYGSLDYESRFVGKEIIGLFANRFGKSTMAVGLAIVTARLDSYRSSDENEGQTQQRVMNHMRRLHETLAVLATVWLLVALRLVSLLGTSVPTVSATAGGFSDSTENGDKTNGDEAVAKRKHD